MVDTGRYVVPRYGRFLIVLGPLLPPEATTQLLQIATAYGHNLPILHDSIIDIFFFAIFFSIDVDNFLLPKWVSICDARVCVVLIILGCFLSQLSPACLDGAVSHGFSKQSQRNKTKSETDTFLPRFFLQESMENGKSNQVIFINP